MQRVLDLDLDAFIYGTAHFRASDASRLEANDYPVWPIEKVRAFLEAQCKLTAPLPGFVVENHGEVFLGWRAAIAAGRLRPPFHVTHVDAHADLGMGDCGYIYLLTELLQLPPLARAEPKIGSDGLGDGNFLAFALANRWLTDLEYVIGGRPEHESEEPIGYPWQPGDLLPYLFEDFDLWKRTFRLPTLERRNLTDNLLSTERLEPLALEPPVPFKWNRYQDFEAAEPFDLICLARSPPFTPPERLSRLA